MMRRVHACLLLLLLSTSLAFGQAQLINGSRVIAGWINAGTTAGTSTAYTLTLTPAMPGYVPATCFLFFIHAANTGPATVNVNGLGAKSFKKWSSGALVDLAANDFLTGRLVQACYDGIVMQVMSLGEAGTGGGGGSGDASTNTSTSVVNELPLFADTSGKLFKRSTQTGILKGTAGVVGTATAGTDYVDPAGLTTGLATKQDTVTWGAGLTATGATARTDSTKAGFLTDGGVGNLSCGTAAQGKAQVMDGGEVQYCDGAATSILHSGLLTQAGLTWNVTPGTCTGDANGGKLTVNGSSQIVCNTTLSGDVTAVGSCTTGDCFTAATPGQSQTFQAISAPAAPSSGNAIVYTDSANGGVLATKNNAGTVTHTAQSKAAVANQFLTALSDAGVLTGAQPSLANLSDAGSVLTTTSTHRVTGKQIVSRVCVVTSSPITPDVDNCDWVIVNSIGTNITINAPVGSGGNPANLQEVNLYFFTSAPRTLTWNAVFTAAAGITLPTSTTGNGTTYDYVKAVYNANATAWHILASTQIPPTVVAGSGYIHLPVTGIQLVASGATIDSSQNNRVLVFDSTANGCAIWDITVPGDYASGGTFRWWGVMESDTTTSHTVTFQVSVMALKAGAAINTDSYGSNNACGVSAIPGSADFPISATGTSCGLTNFDSAAINEPIKIRMCHDNADTSTGNIRITRARFEYAK